MARGEERPPHRTGLNSEYTRNSGNLQPRSRFSDQWMENYQKKTRGVEGFWVTLPNRILAEGRHQLGSGGGWGIWSDTKGDTKYQGWGILGYNDLPGFLLKLGSWRTCPRMEPSLAQKNPTEVWWRRDRVSLSSCSRKEETVFFFVVLSFEQYKFIPHLVAFCSSRTN